MGNNSIETDDSNSKKYGWERPVRFKVGTDNFVVIANPAHAVAIWKNSRYLSAKSITERAAKHLLDLPASVMPFYQADDSGMAAEPRKGSNVPPENRVLYHQTHSAQKFLASPYLDLLVDRYQAMLHAALERLDIGEDDWVEFPDLYQFCQLTIARANTEAMMGEKVFELNPSLMEDFWAAKAWAPEYFMGWPRWMVPTAFAARDKVVKAIRKWHDYAFAHGDHTTTAPEDPDWDPVWGSKYVKARQQYMLAMKPLDEHIRSLEDWGFLFGYVVPSVSCCFSLCSLTLKKSANGNTVPPVYWFLLEAMRDGKLADRMLDEVKASGYEYTGAVPRRNIKALVDQPLLQSVYSEVLRLRVSILQSRVVEFSDIMLPQDPLSTKKKEGQSYNIPQGSYVLIPTDGLHFNDEAWARFLPTRSGSLGRKPLSEFDAERFLTPSLDLEGREGRAEGVINMDFTQENLAGLWMPFGGGERMCPGRHLAKIEMLVSFAYLFGRYDMQIADEKAGREVVCDRKYAPFSSLPPDRPVKFRMRKRRTA